MSGRHRCAPAWHLPHLAWGAVAGASLTAVLVFASSSGTVAQPGGYLGTTVSPQEPASSPPVVPPPTLAIIEVAEAESDVPDDAPADGPSEDPADGPAEEPAERPADGDSDSGGGEDTPPDDSTGEEPDPAPGGGPDTEPEPPATCGGSA